MNRPSPLRVMLVDDDALRRARVRRTVLAAGTSVCLESDYRGVSRCSRSTAGAGVILLSIEIDEADECGGNTPTGAFLALEHLRATYPWLPVLAYSGSVSLPLFRRAMDAGVRDFLPLPLDAAVLRQSIEVAHAATLIPLDAPPSFDPQGAILHQPERLPCILRRFFRRQAHGGIGAPPALR